MNYIILLLMLFNLGISSQQKTEPEAIIMSGRCYEVLEFLNTEFKSDTVALSYFKENYKPVRPVPDKLKDKKFAEYVDYYSKAANRKIICFHKDFYYENTLLIDTSL